jgi:membrane protease YdiL (CAAX protease family)
MRTDSADCPSDGDVGAQLDKRVQLIEVAVFLFLIGPSLVLSLFLVNQGNVSFMLTAVATILRDLSFLSLILFFLWRNGEPVLNIGWTLRDARRDILLGCALFVPVFFGAAALDSILSTIGFSSPSTPLPSLQPSRSALQMVTAVVLVAIVAVAEETIFRGYLMLRFDIFGSSTLTVLLSAFVFSLGHGYEGTAGVVTVGVLGAVFSLVYLWRGSLIAPITMHFLQDFVSIVFVPLLAGK